MASERLISVYAQKIGTTDIGRPIDASYRATRQKIESRSDGTLGPHGRDRGPWAISCSLGCEDPTAVPTVLALSYPLAVEAAGRLVNAGAYRKFAVAHGVLTGFALNLAELAAGDVRFDLQNQGLNASTALSDELTVAAGSAPPGTSRHGTIRFAKTGHSFTPDGGDAVTIPGITRLSYTARADVRAGADTGSAVIDELDIFGWLISGSLTFGDMSITSELSLAEYLATLCTGTLVVQLALTGKTTDQTPPTDKVFTFARIKFDDPDERLTSRQEGVATANFDALLLDAEGAEMTIAQMITCEDLA